VLLALASALASVISTATVAVTAVLLALHHRCDERRQEQPAT
jgi:hypothetical protein